MTTTFEAMEDEDLDLVLDLGEQMSKALFLLLRRHQPEAVLLAIAEVFIVTLVKNGSDPADVKAALDLYHEEWIDMVDALWTRTHTQ